jgi:salicylate hydroxylase
LEFLKTLNKNGTAPPPTAKLKLDIIVVGAGLGGLATAIALQQSGHKVTIFEQTPELGEV